MRLVGLLAGTIATLLAAPAFAAEISVDVAANFTQPAEEIAQVTLSPDLLARLRALA